MNHGIPMQRAAYQSRKENPGDKKSKSDLAMIGNGKQTSFQA